jgi:thiamine pyrophosphate-dependent acetolactate synthase large subunit-like protein
MPHLTGAKAAIATLRSHNVDTIFGIPGVHTLPLYDVMRDEVGLRHILARHEQGAGFMADGYARVSGRVGIVSTITGPGVTNVATPVANAYSDSVPLLVISSSLPRSSTGRPAGKLHEVKDQLGVMEALAGWTRSVKFVEEIPTALYDAFRTLRSGRPRAAYLQIPLDLLALEADVEIPEPATIVPARPSEQDIATAAHLLQESRRPLIVAGAGVTMAGANAQLARLAERLQAPVLLGNKSHDVLPSDHPLVFTLRGSTMPADLRALLGESDVVLVVGSKLGGVRTGNGRLPLSPPIIQIDIDPAEIGRNYPVAVGVIADARLALDALLEALPDTSERPSRAHEVATVREALRKRIRQVFGESVVMLDAVREALPHKGVIVADMTMLGYASAEYLPIFEPRTFIHPAELCSIGCGLPMALGAKAAAPDRPVVVLCGDGGFLLNVGELATAVQEKLDLVVVVFNDATYTAVKNDQYLHYDRRYIATDLVAPDYVALARAFGTEGVHANSPDKLRDAISVAISHPGTTLIEVALPFKQWSA